MTAKDILKKLTTIQFQEIPEFFAYNTFVLKLAGIWIPHKNLHVLLKIITYIYNTFWLTFSCILFVILEILAFPVTIQDYTYFIKNVSLLSTHIVTHIKIFFWFTNGRRILQLLKQLDKMTYIYEEYQSAPSVRGVFICFSPKLLVWNQRSLANRAINLFLFTAMGMSVSALFSCTFTLLFDYETNFFYETSGDSNATIARYEQILPYPSLIPFDHKTSRLAFFGALCFQVVVLMNYAWIIVGFDTLFTSIMSFICAHLMIVQGAIKTIRPRCLQRLHISDNPLLIQDSLAMQNAMNAEFKKCSRHLQRIIHTCDKLEEMYTMLTFVQVFLTLAVFCTNLYLVSSSPIDTELSAEFMYMIAILNQLMLYCYFGHRVTISAESIPLAIYEGDWYSTNLAFKKSMLITMTRMLKPIHFTIGKFSPLTLSTFVTISRASYSFFTVLKSGQT